MTGFDFRERQRRSRWQTIGLVALFAVLVVALSAGIGLVLGYFVGWRRPSAMVAMGLLVMGVILYAAGVKLYRLGGDGARVARSIGAEEVSEGTRNLYRMRCLNVVEEMAIAAGLPVPRAFVIKHEKGINAFAAGNSPEQAAIGVTHGALAMLSREELAGVVAHEMAHIANRDITLNTRLLAMVFGLVALYVVGKDIFEDYRCDHRNSLLTAVGGVLMGLGWLGVGAGRILQAGVSQRREYLADAGAVQFTRNPMGLANALKKIAATEAGSHVRHPHAEEARHMFFAGAKDTFGRFLATHPPLEERIRALDPGFDPLTDPIVRLEDAAILRQVRGELVAG